MDNYSIKTVAFGGFNKQDVIAYIEKSAKESAALQKEYEDEIAALRAQVSALNSEADALRAEMAETLSERDALATVFAKEQQLCRELEALKPAAESARQLQSEIDALRPDAQAYAQLRDHLGVIECEARKRANDLETATAAQLLETVDLFRRQYQILMNTFETTAAHVTAELRKMEVSLSHLPRAMDQAGSDLNALAAQLKKED